MDIILYHNNLFVCGRVDKMNEHNQKIEDIKKKVMRKCIDRINSGEKRIETGTLPGLKRKWI